MSLRVRAARTADVPAILAINKRGRPGVSLLSPGDVDAMVRSAERIWVADDLDGIVGYLISIASGGRYTGEEYRWFEAQFATFLYIDQVAVAPTHRRVGVAAALYKRIACLAAERGFDRLVCEVNLRPANPGSLRFHASQGFTMLNSLEVSDGRMVALMVKAMTRA
jgi:predicted GNAT superfamily acetyltransferase